MPTGGVLLSGWGHDLLGGFAQVRIVVHCFIDAVVLTHTHDFHDQVLEICGLLQDSGRLCHSGDCRQHHCSATAFRQLSASPAVHHRQAHAREVLCSTSGGSNAKQPVRNAVVSPQFRGSVWVDEVAVGPAAPKADVLLELRNVHKSFGPKRILQGATMEVRRGQAIGIIGKQPPAYQSWTNYVHAYASLTVIWPLILSSCDMILLC